MSRLNDFLALPDVSSMSKDVYINERIGTIKIKPMTEPEYAAYQNGSKGKITKDGTSFDGSKFNLLVVAGQIIEPDFSNAEFLDKVGMGTAREFIKRKFLPGEISDIADKIIKLSGFETNINEDIEEAKNS